MVTIRVRDRRELEVKDGYKDLTYLGEEVVRTKPRGDDNKTDEPNDPKPKVHFA